MPPVAGQLALVIVQLSPTVVSVHSETTVLPAASEDIFAPLSAVVPSASLVIAIVALVIADAAALVSPLV